jgi:predicted glycosyltransferase involved in capsule biosynthesis
MFSIIIPLRIDHKDRLINAEIVLNYLINNIKDKEIIIIENSSESYYERMNLTDRKEIIHIHQKNNDELFHRMKCINDGLSIAKYPITLIYDIDVLLPVKVFEELIIMILTDKYDIVKPFANPPGCIYIHQSNKDDLLEKSIKGEPFDIENYEMKKDDKTGFAGNGFVVCVNTEIYKSLGGENEGFLAYGPEDNERYYRFQKLDKKVGCLHNPVYHLEHFRTNNSCKSNPTFNANEELYNYIRNMSKKELYKYYQTKNKFF